MLGGWVGGLGGRALEDTAGDFEPKGLREAFQAGVLGDELPLVRLEGREGIPNLLFNRLYLPKYLS